MPGNEWRACVLLTLAGVVGCGDRELGLHLTIGIPGEARPVVEQVIVNVEAHGGLATSVSDTMSQDVTVHAGDGSLELTIPQSVLAAHADDVPLLLAPSGAHPLPVTLRAWMFGRDHQVLGASPFVLSSLGSDRASAARLSVACAADSSCAPGTPASTLDLATANAAPLGIALGVGGSSQLGLLGVGHFRPGNFGDVVLSSTSAAGARVYVVRAPDWAAPGFPLLNKQRTLLASPAVVVIARADAPFSDAAALGDLDGDGLDELVLAAPSAAAGAGAVYVFSGAELAQDGATIDLRDPATYARIPRVIGAAAQDQLGSAVAIGPVRTAGVNDLILGAPGAAGITGATAGRVYALGLPVKDSIAGSSPQTTTLSGDAPGTPIGAVVAVGDLDGDGLAELVLGSPTDGGQQRGVVRVFRGSGLQPGLVDLASTPSDGRIVGEEGALLGSSLVVTSGAQKHELVAGAPGRDTVYAIAGEAAFLAGSVEGLVSSIRIEGLAGSGFGTALSSVTLAEGRAGLAVAAPRANLGDRLRAGACFLFADEDRPRSSTPQATMSIDDPGSRLVIYGAAAEAALGLRLSTGVFDAAGGAALLLMSASVDANGQAVMYAVRAP